MKREQMAELFDSPVEGEVRWTAGFLRKRGIPVEVVTGKMQKGRLPVDGPLYILLVPASLAVKAEDILAGYEDIGD